MAPGLRASGEPPGNDLRPRVGHEAPVQFLILLLKRLEDHGAGPLVDAGIRYRHGNLRALSVVAHFRAYPPLDFAGSRGGKLDFGCLFELLQALPDQFPVRIAEQLRIGPCAIDPGRRGKHAQAGPRARRNRDQHARDAQLAGDFHRMDRAGAAGGDHRELPRIVAVFSNMDACRAGHVFVDHVVDAPCGIGRRHAELLRQPPHRGFGEAGAQRHLPAKEIRRIQIPEQQIRVGDGRIRSATAVARRARHRPGGFRPDVQQAEPVAKRNRSSARADFDQIDARNQDRQSGTAFESCHARAFEAVGDRRLATDRHAGLCRGAAHVERQHVMLVVLPRRVQCREDAGGGSGFQQQDRRLGAGPRRCESSARDHYAQRNSALDCLDARFELLKVLRGQRLHIGVCGGRGRALELLDLTRELRREGHRQIGHRCLERVADLLFVRVIDIGMQQRHGNRIHPQCCNGQRHPLQLRRVERGNHFAARVEPFVDFDAAIGRHQRLGQYDLQIVDVVAPFASNVERVAHAPGRDQSGAGARALDQGIGDECGAVHGFGQLRRRRPHRCGDLAQQAQDHRRYGFSRISRSRGRLGDPDPTGGGQRRHTVGKRPPDVHGHTQSAGGCRSNFQVVFQI